MKRQPLVVASSRALSLVYLLLAIELFDELYSSVGPLSASSIRSSLGLDYAGAAAALLFVPAGVAMVVEPAMFVLSDRFPRRWFVCGGLAMMAAAAFGAAMATGIVTMTLAMTLAYLGSGSGVALAQATLVDAQPPDVPGAVERALARWTLLGEVGDLMGPLLVGGLAALAIGWRSGFVAVGLMAVLLAVLLLVPAFPPARDDEEGEEEEDGATGVLSRLREGLANRELIRWLAATALCDLLDDMVVVFAVLHMRDDLGFAAETRSAVVAAGVVGSILGVVLTERSAAPPRRILIGSSLFCAAAYGGWILTSDPWLSGALFAMVGLGAAPMYPLTVARAYAAWPGRSGAVNAVGHLFSPLTLAAPAVVGFVADAHGLPIALALLLLQPFGVGLFSLMSKDDTRERAR